MAVWWPEGYRKLPESFNVPNMVVQLGLGLGLDLGLGLGLGLVLGLGLTLGRLRSALFTMFEQYGQVVKT